MALDVGYPMLVGTSSDCDDYLDCTILRERFVHGGSQSIIGCSGRRPFCSVCIMAYVIERLLVRPLVTYLAPYGPALPYGMRNVVLESVAMFVVRQISMAPLHVRVGAFAFGILLRLWLAALAPSAERSFGAPLRVARALELFEHLPGPSRAIVRFYRSMTMLGYYEHAAVMNALDLPDPALRRKTFHALRSARLSKEVAS